MIVNPSASRLEFTTETLITRNSTSRDDWSPEQWQNPWAIKKTGFDIFFSQILSFYIVVSDSLLIIKLIFYTTYHNQKLIFFHVNVILLIKYFYA